MKGFLTGLFISTTACAQINLTKEQARELGSKIWYNECRNSVEKLTFWKKGEQWASLGIGHFIWYPAGKKGIYEEQFPQLIKFFADHKIKLPAWLTPTTPCPWASQEAFTKDLHSPGMQELRAMLASTIDLQAEFIVRRFEQTVPNLINGCSQQMSACVRQQIVRLGQSSQGLYAMIDYMNYKGEGTSASERYAGKGWGLLQVLEGMRSDAKPLD